MKLTFVVPVYNVEQYIVKCVRSLLSQDYSDYEIVIVNDGTPDRSIEVLNESVQDNRIRIINQENKGLSAARNTGLRHAEGDYVWFFDSDDWLSSNCLPDIASTLDECDVLYFNGFIKECMQESIVYHKNIHVNSGRELSLCDIWYPAPFYIYNRYFLQKNGLEFENGLYHEDTMFTPITLYRASSVIAYDAPVYHYYSRNNSIMNSVNPKRCYDLIKIIKAHDLFCKNEVEDKDKLKWGNCIADSINGLLSHCIACNNSVQSDVSFFFQNNKDLYNYLCHARKRPTRILGYLAKYNKLSIISLYKILSILRYKI